MRPVMYCGGKKIEFGKRTIVMGILNVTPDSFADGGKYATIDAAIEQACHMLEFGADIIDIGGESTRPFAKAITLEEELQRVVPVVRALVARGMTQLSIDTRRAEVARICLSEGASWINDVSAGTYDDGMFSVMQKADGVVLMHARGQPETMQQGEIIYENVVLEIAEYLKCRTHLAVQAGVDKDKIIVDVGVGFGKRLSHNLDLIRHVHAFHDIGAGVLMGVSRKAFIGELTGLPAPERDNATLGAVAMCVANGADIVRVHHVRATRESLKVVDLVVRG